jgi:hypothetical protein
MTSMPGGWSNRHENCEQVLNTLPLALNLINTTDFEPSQSLQETVETMEESQILFQESRIILGQASRHKQVARNGYLSTLQLADEHYASY